MSAERDEVVLGQTLAKALNAEPGATNVMLSATSPAGRMNALGVVVRGLASLHLPYESQRGVTVPLSTAQAVIGLPGEVTEVAFGARDGADLDAIAAQLREELGPTFEVHTWPVLEPYLFQTIIRLGRATSVVSLILLLVVLAGIASTMTMSVHERKQEIGTMLALGLTRGAIVVLFVLEAWLIGLTGATAGASLGAMLVAVAGTVGIEAKQIDNPALLYPAVNGAHLLLSVAVTSLGAVLAALVQARRAANLDPIEALRAR
ncbi:MAG: ABC transporter permease [Archangium sp.]|nr:ABC transporter permease [Archangium sp.]